MPEGGGAPKTGLKISFILLGLVLVASAVCYVYFRWHQAQRFAEQLPVLGVESLVKGVRDYQRETGQFPITLVGLEERRIWKSQPPHDFGASKTTLSSHNYYYMYSRAGGAGDLVCTIWAIPSGPRREEATTHFLVVGPLVIRRWKGPALTKADIDKLEPVPSADTLRVMGMTEQPMIDERRGKTASASFGSQSN